MILDYDLLLIAAQHYVYLKKYSLIWRIVKAYYALNSVLVRVAFDESLPSILSMALVRSIVFRLENTLCST